MITVFFVWKDDVGWSHHEKFVIPGAPRVGDYIDIRGIKSLRKVKQVVWCTYDQTITVILEDGD